MGFTTTFNGILFDEGERADFQPLGRVEVDIGGVITSAQLKSLADVKSAMAVRAKTMGGNCICCFTYGQRSSGFLASLFSRDDVYWYGTGIVGTVQG